MDVPRKYMQLPPVQFVFSYRAQSLFDERISFIRAMSELTRVRTRVHTLQKHGHRTSYTCEHAVFFSLMNGTRTLCTHDRFFIVYL